MQDDVSSPGGPTSDAGPARETARAEGGMTSLIRSFDWSHTSLGPISQWPKSLRSLVDMLLAHPLPMIVLWGPEHVQIYNDGYAAIAGRKHPAALGQRTQACWPEVWHINGPIYERVMRDGESVLLKDQLFPITRNGAAEDAYFTLSYSPVRDDAHAIAGVILTVVETTPAVLAARDRARREAAEAMREHDAEYRSLFDAMDEGFLLAEVIFEEGRPVDIIYLAANPAATRMTRVDYVGRTLMEIDRDYEPYWLEIWGRVATTGVGERHERYAAPLDMWFDFFVFRVGGDGSRRVAVVFSDVTDRRRSEAHAAFLSGLAVEFERLRGPDEIMQTIGARVGTYMGVSAVAFLDIDLSLEREMNARYVWSRTDVADLRQQFRIKDYLSPEFERANRAGESVIVCDTQSDARTGAAPYASLDVHAFVTVPFFREGEWRYCMALSDNRPRNWRADEVELFDTLAGLIFPRLERARAEERLRESEERQAFLLQLTDAMRPLADAADVQGRAARLLGEHLGVSRAAYYEVGESDYVIERDYVRGVPSTVGRHAIRSFGAALVAAHRRGDPIVVEDVDSATDLSPVERAAFASIQVRAYVGVPLLKDGHVVAGLTTHSASPRRWTAAEVSLIVETAERTWAAVERARAEAALRKSEARFRLMADAVPQIVWITDQEGRVLFFNRPWSDYTGATFDPETASDVAAHFVHPDDAAATMAAFDAARHTGGTFSVEHRIRSASGEYRWFIVRGEPYRDPQTGKITRWFGASVDIDDRVRTDAALRESEERFRLLVDNARDHAVFTLSLEGRVATWNPGGERIFQFTADEIIGQTAAALFTPEDQAAGVHAAEMATAARDGRASDDRWQMRKDGTRFWANGVTSAMRDGAGQLRGFTKVLRDMTAAKRAEEDRERLLQQERAARAEAERATTMKDEFLAVVSHELRTPLSAILLWTRLLGDGVVKGEEQREAFDAIGRSAEAQKRLIEDLLDVSQMTLGQPSLHVREADLTEVLRAAVGAVRPMAEAKGVDVTLALGPTVGPLRIDPARIQQVVWNVLNNAVKFTEAGGTVRVSLAPLRSGARIEVRDTGRGIRAEFLPHVFERFRQEDASTTRTVGGLGLGLAIAQQIVELHGGTIGVESEGPGKGATFTIELPGSAKPAPTRTAAPSPAPASDVVRKSGLRVLLVEDDANTRAAIAQLLKSDGAEVTAVASATPALDAFVAGRFDVVVCDIGLPERNGYELMRELREIEAADGRPPTPAIALSAYPRPDDRQAAAPDGFQSHVTKPIEPSTLLAAVAAALATMSR